MSSSHRHWRRAAVGFAVFLGAVNILSALTPTLSWRHAYLVHVVPLVIRGGSRLLTVIAGFLLFVTSPALGKGKRTAWVVTLTLVLVSTFLHLLKGLDYEEAAVTMAFGVFLLAAAGHFQARSDAPSIRTGLNILVAAVLFNLLYAVTGLYLWHHHLSLKADGRTILAAAFYLASFSFYPGLAGLTPVSRWFLDSAYGVNSASLLTAVWMLLRPVAHRQHASLQEHELARNLAERWGRSSLVFFTLWPDKLYYFPAAGDCYVAYRQVGDTAVALGDPVGAPEKIRAAIEEFINLADENGWYPVFYQVLPDFLPAYRQAGLNLLKIGEEALIPLENFSLSGRAWKEVRYSVNKASRAGLGVRFYDPPLDDSLLDRLAEVSEAWLRFRHVPEKGFSLGWFARQVVRDLLVATVEDRHGRIYAFADFVPMYHLPQASPDLMRYQPDAPAGAMDLLIVEAAYYFQQRGYLALNLGLAPLASITPEEKEGLAGQAEALLFRSFANLQGLYHFKAKYNPAWEPRYLAYPGTLTLPKAALAVVRAGNPQGLRAYFRPVRRQRLNG
ncbi:MAG: bifunctional lysylphosphatidylglycerol flippase/synthetase MprF [Clostridia bacterium]|nr:MAG: bifunctional lysylphosphatidylglycerol flippase/synthetase MprF [Clostridia bacterium]